MTALSDVEVAAQEAAVRRDAHLDLATRRAGGVVHTPPAICRFVVRRLNAALRRGGLDRGLRTAGLTVVDPACGTGAFFASLLQYLGPDERRLQLLGIDSDGAAVKDCVATFGDSGARFIHLDALSSQDFLPLDGPLAVLGNPPWAARSASKTPLSEEHLEVFRRDVDGRRLRERKLGVLSDAYVRFFAWVHAAFAERPGAFAFVSNSSFLDGPVHRGMRSALLKRFGDVELTDLDGSSLVARASGENGNVFGVRPGVVVAVGATAPKSVVRFATVEGTREQKTAALEADPEFELITPTAPFYFLRPIRGAAFPSDWVGLDELFVFHREGVQTNRDAVVVDVDKERLIGRMQAFALQLARADVEQAERPTAHYDPERARSAVRRALENAPAGDGWIETLAYRPFDQRYFVTLPEICHRSRKTLRAAMAHSAFALVTVRKDRGGRGWSHLAVARAVPDNCLLSARSSCRARAFPTHGPDGRSNLSDRGRSFGAPFGDSVGLLEYAAAWLSSPTYRERFGGVLPLGYPKIPPPGPNAEAIRRAGAALTQAFLSGDPASEGEPRPIGHWKVPLSAALLAAVECAEAEVRVALS